MLQISTQLIRISRRRRISASNDPTNAVASRVAVLLAFPTRLVALIVLSAWNSLYAGSAKDTSNRRRSLRNKESQPTEREVLREQRLVSSPYYYLPCPVSAAYKIAGMWKTSCRSRPFRSPPLCIHLAMRAGILIY